MQSTASSLQCFLPHHTLLGHTDLNRCSFDGVRWNESALLWTLPGVGVGEPPSFAYWNAVSGRYGFSARPMWGDRRVTCVLPHVIVNDGGQCCELDVLRGRHTDLAAAPDMRGLVTLCINLAPLAISFFPTFCRCTTNTRAFYFSHCLCSSLDQLINKSFLFRHFTMGVHHCTSPPRVCTRSAGTTTRWTGPTQRPQRKSSCLSRTISTLRSQNTTACSSHRSIHPVPRPRPRLSACCTCTTLHRGSERHRAHPA
jgi:hypothetical protein